MTLLGHMAEHESLIFAHQDLHHILVRLFLERLADGPLDLAVLVLPKPPDRDEKQTHVAVVIHDIPDPVALHDAGFIRSLVPRLALTKTRAGSPLPPSPRPGRP